VLRARPEPETPNRASPCPSAWTACGFGAQAFSSASAFNANIGAWNTAAVTTLSFVCAAPGPGGAQYVHTYNIHLSVDVRIGRDNECVHQCAMGMDRLCAHALAGSCCGLGLKPETLNRASPCPSASTACGCGAQAFQSASVFNANIGAWNTASVVSLYSVCAAFPARRRALWQTRSAGLRCGAARCVRRHRRCARACAHVQALACAGPWV
jgi:hypothetical protein